MRTTDEEKSSIRTIVRRLKSNQPAHEYMAASASIMQQMEMLPEFADAKTVMAYWSITGEVFTHDAIRKWSQSRKIILPSVDGDVLQLKQYIGTDNLVAGDRYQIPEPDGPLFADVESIDLIIVPGIAFDRQNNRMGRGKAYYDKFLQSLRGTKVGVCFNFQLFNTIPCDAHDIAMDRVISDVSESRQCLPPDSEFC